MAQLDVSIVTPEGPVFKGGAESLVVPGSEGAFGVLPGHAPLIAAIREGSLTVRQTGSLRVFTVSSGFVQVLKDRVIVLADRGRETASGEPLAAAH